MYTVYDIKKAQSNEIQPMCTVKEYQNTETEKNENQIFRGPVILYGIVPEPEH